MIIYIVVICRKLKDHRSYTWIAPCAAWGYHLFHSLPGNLTLKLSRFPWSASVT
jgi:hypothetical protein